MTRPSQPGTRWMRMKEVGHAFEITLCQGFRGHTVIITVDGQVAYHRSGVTTDPGTSRADAIAVTPAGGAAHIGVAVAPGDVVASLDVDVVAHPRVAISLVGDGTISFETFGTR